MVCTSCKTSYNVLISRLGTASNCAYGEAKGVLGQGWGRGLVIDIRGRGNVKERVSRF